MDIYLIEDNFVQGQLINSMLLHITDEININAKTFVYPNGEIFLSQVNLQALHRKSVFFLDIDLNSKKSGIDIAEILRHELPDCFIYFITSNAAKAIEIVNKNILPSGYLVKSVEQLEQLNQQLKKIISNLVKDVSNDKYYMQIKQGGEINFIDLSDVILIESIPQQKGYVHLYTKKDTLLFRSTISQIKEKIFAPFMITNLKSYIINKHFIKLIDRKLGIIVLENNLEIYVSKRIINKVLKSVAE